MMLSFVRRPWLSIREFAALYGYDRRSVWYMLKRGAVYGIRVGGPRGDWRILNPGRNLRDRLFQPPEENYLLKTSEVAAITGLSEAWIRHSDIACKKVGKNRRYTVAETRRVVAELATGKRRPSRREVETAMIEWAKGRMGTRPALAPVPTKTPRKQGTD